MCIKWGLATIVTIWGWSEDIPKAWIEIDGVYAKIVIINIIFIVIIFCVQIRRVYFTSSLLVIILRNFDELRKAYSYQRRESAMSNSY
jgi:hypothetical protein